MKQVKLMKLHNDATMPKFAKRGDSGFDMYTLEDTIIKAGETKIVKTGIAADLEEGYEIQVRPRSGVSLNGCKGCYRFINSISKSIMTNKEHVTKIEDSVFESECISDGFGIKITSSQKETVSPYLRVQLGTVDSGYKGDIGIITYNQENYNVLVPKGTRLAQCVVMEVPVVEIVEVFELSESERGNSGYGSSGIK